MELDYALLANSAEVGAGGRVHIFGAHIDTICSPQFPATTGFTLVARLLVAPNEYDQRHRFVAELVLPSGQRRSLMAKDQEFVTAAGAIRPELGSAMSIIVQAAQVELDAPGDYAIRLVVDGQEMGSVPFYVRELEVEA